MKKIKLNKRDVIVLIVVACIVIFAFCRFVVYETIQDYKFANQMENIYAKNEKAVFAIDKIVLYSSANAIDNSQGQTMQDLNICQFTDMAIYIDNKSYIEQATQENTVKELYIDNIKINAASNKGQKTLSYKSPLRFGKFRAVTQNNTNNDNFQNQGDANQEQDSTAIKTEDNNQANSILSGEGQTAEQINNENNYNINGDEEQQDRINFDILYTNEDNEKSDYTTPTFYTDCSNPITLSYMNKNIVTGYAVSTQDTQITFDGKILQSVGIDLDDLACVLNFDIHLKNNLNQEFVCSMGIDIPLKNENRTIYSGYMYGMDKDLQKTYSFFKK